MSVPDKLVGGTTRDLESALTQDASGIDGQPKCSALPSQDNVLSGAQNPRNWATHTKVSIALIYSLTYLVTLMSSSMMAAAIGHIADDLAMSTSMTYMASSIYVLGLGFGPFIIGPLSELYGRKPLWLVCNVWYILWNSLCPVGSSAGLMIAGRLLAGCGASAGLTLTAPVMADMYDTKDRGKSLAITTFLPYFGPALGPLVGGLATQHLHWAWTFWILSILNSAFVLVGIMVVRETYIKVLVRRNVPVLEPQPVVSNRVATILRPIGNSLARPIRMLLFRPVVLFLSANLALNFAIYYLLLSTFATLWVEGYGESETSASLHYIALTVGATIATQGGGWLMDAIWKRLCDRLSSDGAGKPEFRIPHMVLGSALMPVGLIWYGWTAESRQHWAVVDAGVIVFTCANFILAQGLLAYMLDEFEHESASAGAATRLAQNILACMFPIFAPQLYERFGYGWGNSLLALIFVAVGFPSLAVMWFWGPQLRALSRSRSQ